MQSRPSVFSASMKIIRIGLVIGDAQCLIAHDDELDASGVHLRALKYDIVLVLLKTQNAPLIFTKKGLNNHI